MMLLICMLRRRRRAVFCDSTAFDRKKSPLKEKAKAMFFRRCDGFFCYGSRSKQYVAGYGIDPEQDLRWMPIGGTGAWLRCGCHTRVLRRNRLFPPIALSRFLYIGRLAEEKGLFDLLDAFARVRQQLPAARLDLVGSGVLEGELRQRAEQLGIDSA